MGCCSSVAREPPFSKDPTERPSQQRRRRSLPGTPSSPALCKQCNVSLQIDDSFLKKSLETSDTGDLYLGGRDMFMPHLVYGGIDYVREDYVATLPGLSQAADGGCKFCAAVKEGLQKKYQGTPWWKPHPEPLVLRFEYCWEVNDGRTTLQSVVVSIKHPELGRDSEIQAALPDDLRLEKWESHVFRFLTYGAGDEDPCRKWLGLKRKLSGDPWSPQNISMCQRWINECIDEKGLCKGGKTQLLGPAPKSNDGSDECSDADGDTNNRNEEHATGGAGAGAGAACTRLEQPGKHTGSLFLPTRLLDLFPVPAQSPGCIKLVDTADLQRNMISDESGSHVVSYAALSYCWGNVKPTTLTTKDTLDSRLRCIELLALPQCLQDAVTVTRGLGIRYLWIDALCIIQDDSDDWGREAGRMYQIFYNSFVTIAAAASESFNEGFLIPRQIEAVEVSFSSALNPLVAGSFSLSTLAVPSRLQQDRADRLPLASELRHCKWDTRGWVWQEQKLSKRLLVFGKEMIHLKCAHCIRSENGVNIEDVNPSREDGRESWTTCLEEFAGKQLTFIQDKLPAISGMFKQLDQISRLKGEGPAQYLAGIWHCPGIRDARRGWQSHLLWALTSRDQSFQNMVEQLKSTDPQSYNAPSWSWASRCERRASWIMSEYSGVSPPHFEAEIENHQMILTGPDPMGRVGPGCYLELSGLMCRDPLDIAAAERTDRLYGHGWEWEIRPTTPYGFGGQWETLTTNLYFTPDWKFSAEDERDDRFECGIQLFGLYRWESNDRPGLRGLLLLQDSESGHYFRVGAFYVDDYGDSELYEGWERQSVRIL